MGYQILQFPETYCSRTGFILMEFLACVGDFDIVFYSDAKRMDKDHVVQSEVIHEFGRTIYQIATPLNSLLAVITPKVFRAEGGANGDQYQEISEYMVKPRYIYNSLERNKDFRVIDNGAITFKAGEENSKFDL